LVGSHTGQKGHAEAIKIFYRAKIKNATLLIVGNKGKCLNLCKEKERNLNNSKEYKTNMKKLLVLELNREETVSAFQSADLFLFPSNAECSPVVLFEAMASKTPFMITDVGNAKEIIEWSGGGLLLPTIYGVNLNTSLKSYVKRLIKKILSPLFGFNQDKNYNLCKARIAGSTILLENIYNDEEKRCKLSETGYKSWQEKFTWDKIAQRYEELYKKL